MLAHHKAPVHVVEISHAKAMDGEIWITSDGRAYLVGLHEEDSISESRPSSPSLEGSGSSNDEHPPVQLRWHGTCIHDFQTPKWVQKRRQIEPEEEGREGESSGAYQEPKRATKVAINSKFSLIAIGTHG